MTLDQRISSRALRGSYWYATIRVGSHWVGGIPSWSWRALQRRIRAGTWPVGSTIVIERWRAA